MSHIQAIYNIDRNVENYRELITCIIKLIYLETYPIFSLFFHLRIVEREAPKRLDISFIREYAKGLKFQTQNRVVLKRNIFHPPPEI